MRSQGWKQLLAFAVALIMPFSAMTTAYGEEKDKQKKSPTRRARYGIS
jgi:hypothetical protein